jgi:hypothetical protein
VKDFKRRYEKGYHRPVCMPLWKWIIVYGIWTIAVIGYVGSYIISPWLLILGMLFQVLEFMSMKVFDTGNWRKQTMVKII